MRALVFLLCAALTGSCATTEPRTATPASVPVATPPDTNTADPEPTPAVQTNHATRSVALVALTPTRLVFDGRFTVEESDPESLLWGTLFSRLRNFPEPPELDAPRSMLVSVTRDTTFARIQRVIYTGWRAGYWQLSIVMAPHGGAAGCDLDVPLAGRIDAPAWKPGPAEADHPALNLMVSLREAGIFISGAGGLVQGSDEGGPTLPRTAQGAFDIAALQIKLREIKDAFPDERQSILDPLPEMLWPEIAPIHRALVSNGDELLFPDVVFPGTWALPNFAAGEITTTGALDREAVLGVSRKHFEDVALCFGSPVFGPGGRYARVTLELQVAASGEVEKATVKRGRKGKKMRALGRCLQGSAQTWRFPTRSGATAVTLPIGLAPGVNTLEKWLP